MLPYTGAVDSSQNTQGSPEESPSWERNHLDFVSLERSRMRLRALEARLHREHLSLEELLVLREDGRGQRGAATRPAESPASCPSASFLPLAEPV